MSVWQAIARDFNWKPLFKGEGNTYPCGATQGWAKPISLVPSESQFQDVGCVCHTNLERALTEWKRESVSNLLDRVFELSREAGISVQMAETNGRQRWYDQPLPEKLRPILRELEAIKEKLEMLTLRLRLQRDMQDLPTRREREQSYEPIDKPAPIAGPLQWTDKVYRPR